MKSYSISYFDTTNTVKLRKTPKEFEVRAIKHHEREYKVQIKGSLEIHWVPEHVLETTGTMLSSYQDSHNIKSISSLPPVVPMDFLPWTQFGQLSSAEQQEYYNKLRDVESYCTTNHHQKKQQQRDTKNKGIAVFYFVSNFHH